MEAVAKVSGLKTGHSVGDVASKINSHHKTTVTKNRNYLKCIIDSLLYCARQGISIRGHDETDESKNKGNFIELLHLRAKDNKLLEDSIVGSQIGYRYVSGTHSNAFLSIMAKQVLRNIVNDIKKPNYSEF